MNREKRAKKDMGPAAAALRRRSVFRDARVSSTQLTAAQLIADAQEMQRSGGPVHDSTKVVINSFEELALYRQKTRAEQEERVKRGYSFLGNWVKYAKWEAQQKDFGRMRSVLERAIKFHGTNPVLWRDYAELEGEYGFVNHARAVWDRGVTALPSAADLWLKFLVLEQAAGQQSRARDVFNRWLTGPTPPPTYAWELFALFEAQSGRIDACRDVMRRYVEATGTVEAWLFYGSTELKVFGNAERAVKVYETAMDSIPEEFKNGEVDCRIPLAFADALVAAKKSEKARDVYQQLLRECRSTSALENIFAIYSHFERLHGDNANCEAVAFVMAKAMYQRRIARDPGDLDAYVSQYILLRDAAERGCENSSVLEELQQEMLDCLSSAVCIRIDGAKDAMGAQRLAVVVMEYARLMEKRDITAARAALAECIRNFPFTTAWCPRIWIEAAELEQRQGAYEQARKLLGAALNLSPCQDVFNAALKLEEKVVAAGELSHQDYVQRSRSIFQTAIKQFPHDFLLWEGYAKMEEKEGQFHRADALRVACISTLSAASRGGSLSMAERYKLLDKVDQAWARRLALKRRLLRAEQKRLRTASAGVEREQEEKEEDANKAGRAALLQLCKELLNSVWGEYKYEAFSWKEKNSATFGVLSPPPERMPDVLAPAIARWGQAVAAVVTFALVPANGSAGEEYEASSVCWVRTLFREMVSLELPQLLQGLGGADEKAGFEALQQARRWAQFLLSPMVTEWQRFEATYATQVELDAVKEFVQPAKRRTRLFAKKKQ